MKNKIIYGFILLTGLMSLGACKETRSAADLYALPALTEGGFNLVVEIPAGTNHKIEYDNAHGKFLNDTLDGKTRIIDFLPYPGNYGFIPSTLMDAARGGDGDPLDVLVIGESQPTGSVIEAMPIGVLLLLDSGEIDSKIIAVPRDSSLRTMHALNFKDFLTRYDPARRIVEDWFLNYKGYGVTEMIRWEDDRYAWREIRKWMREGEGVGE